MIIYDDSDEAAHYKSRIRAQKRKQRAALIEDKKEKADLSIYQNFYLSGLVEKYESFFVYNSVNTEASTKSVIAYLNSIGKKVYLPRVVGTQMEAVPLSDRFIKGAFGIEEPYGEAFYGDIDAAIIPAFAFDLHGNRIGYGGGYYDRYLTAHPNIFKIVFGYDFQLLQKIVAEEHDVPVDYLITDKRYCPTICTYGLDDIDLSILKEIKAEAKNKKKSKKKEKSDETKDN